MCELQETSPLKTPNYCYVKYAFIVGRKGVLEAEIGNRSRISVCEQHEILRSDLGRTYELTNSKKMSTYHIILKINYFSKCNIKCFIIVIINIVKVV